jgi:imidazolonepropionase-like amidohydrolase
MENTRLIIRAGQLYDGRSLQSDRIVVVEGSHITEVTDKSGSWDLQGIVTPAFIDPQSHIGMERQGEPIPETETDEHATPFAPLHNPLDSIYFDDRAFADAVDFGVLYSCVVPGSGNIIGGKAVIIKNFAENRSDAVVSDYGFKAALGFNPRNAVRWKGTRPSTRMGAAAMLREYLSDIFRKEENARIKKEKALYELSKPDSPKKGTVWAQREYDLALSDAEWEVFRLFNGEKILKVHLHKADDAVFLMDLTKRFNIRVTAEHGLDIGDKEIFNALADHGIPLVYGPLGASDAKVELKNASWRHTARLMASRAKFGLMSDHPVILAHHLRDTLKYFLIQGMTPADAIGLITRKNAEILGIDHCLGTVAPGRMASLIVWDKDPFHLSAHPLAVLAEGRIIRDRRGLPFEMNIPNEETAAAMNEIRQGKTEKVSLEQLRKEAEKCLV